MYSILEGSTKKGAKFDNIQHKKIVLFSDACGGQNKNYTVFAYLPTLSMQLDVDIWHVFSVRGHSYCQCDRNFGMYSQKKKKLERMETAEEYIKLIRNSRDPPFTMVQCGHNILNYYEKSFKKTVLHLKSMKISRAYVIHYLPNESVEIFEIYTETNVSNFKIKTKVELSGSEINPPPIVGITEANLKNQKSLLKYLTPKGEAFFNEYFVSIMRN